jgi:hypothetical protein
MKHGGGIKSLDDKSNGMEILMPETFHFGERGLSTSLTLHSFSVTLFSLRVALAFFNPVQNKHTLFDFPVDHSFKFNCDTVLAYQ